MILADWAAIPLTIIVIIGVTNATNLSDGLDGLAAGVGAIASVVLLVHMLRVGHYGPALLPAALLGAARFEAGLARGAEHAVPVYLRDRVTHGS